MSQHTSKPKSSKPSPIGAGRVALCLLLAVLFLYNPFFTVQNVSDVPHVRHPHSFRATVASSELRRCTVNPIQPLVPASGVLGASVFIGAPAITVPVVRFVPPRESLPVPQQVVLEDICFRPPPAV